MKYIDEFRDNEWITIIAGKIQKFRQRDYVFMEVCGGHTMAIKRFGINSLLPPNIRLISGPGCPVCVTSKSFIDKAIAYSQLDNTIITSYGDLMRVPGSTCSLEKIKTSGADIRSVYSAFEVLEIARASPDKKIIFLAIGFETTAPGTAVLVREAEKSRINNLFILSAHKIMPPAMEAIIKDGTRLDGFICPGHVSAVAGAKIFDFIPAQYGLPCVVSGFEPLDLLQSILMLIIQSEQKKPKVEIQYSRAVTWNGNEIARDQIKNMFDLNDEWWRGFGIIKKSGLRLKDKFSGFDMEKVYPLSISDLDEDTPCICGEILKGLKTPLECVLFAKKCTPDDPVGACMVTSEGTCHAYYKYNRHE